MSLDLELSPAARRDIIAACERLVLDYAHHFDNGGGDAWANLFAEDAELHLFGKVYEGRKAIRAVSGGSPIASLHVTSNIRIDVLSDTDAEGTAYVTAFTKPKDAPSATEALAPLAAGTYRDVYRRTSEGWRIARRAFEPFLMQGR